VKDILYITVKFSSRDRERKTKYIYINYPRIYFDSLFVSSSKIKMPVQRGLAQECQQHFQTSNLYDIFSINRTATDAQGIFLRNK
jgi:hypothetical protein